MTDQIDTSYYGDDFRRVILSLANHARRERTDRRITLTQSAILGHIYRHGSLFPSEIAEYENLLAPSVTRALNTMEERDLIERQRSKSDRRQVIITITARGKHIVESDRERRNKWFASALSSMTPAAQRRVIRALRDLEQMAQFRSVEYPGVPDPLEDDGT